MKEIDQLEFDNSVKYFKEHTWAKMDGDLTVIGISDYAQDQLGEIIFIELPQPGDSFSQDEVFGVVESVKATSELYMPVGGEIIEVNTNLESTPEIVNSGPFTDGWMIKIKTENTWELNELMMAQEYKNSLV